jgi:hypothetical protein
MVINCAFCAYGPNDTKTPAEFIIDGQAVCADHVDDADGQFGAALNRIWNSND